MIRTIRRAGAASEDGIFKWWVVFWRGFLDMRPVVSVDVVTFKLFVESVRGELEQEVVCLAGGSVM